MFLKEAVFEIRKLLNFILNETISASSVLSFCILIQGEKQTPLSLVTIP